MQIRSILFLNYLAKTINCTKYNLPVNKVHEKYKNKIFSFDINLNNSLKIKKINNTRFTRILI